MAYMFMSINSHSHMGTLRINRDMKRNNVTGMGMGINGDVGWEQWDKSGNENQ